MTSRGGRTPGIGQDLMPTPVPAAAGLNRRSAPPMLGWALLLGLLAFLTSGAHAYPPAPHHSLFGTVRDELGNPVQDPRAEVILETSTGVLLKTTLAPLATPGQNYRLEVPIDAGLTADPYKPTALRPAVAFRIKVKIGAVTYLPIEMKADYARLGQPSGRTRIDLTLGEDSDNDGIPDAWERAIIARSGGTKTLQDVRPGDDADGDGMRNLDEYLAGTYAFDSKDGFTLKIARVQAGRPVLEFLALRGRSYVIEGSADLNHWEPLGFRLPTDSTDTPERLLLQSGDVTKIEAYLDPPTDAGPRFFRLVVR